MFLIIAVHFYVGVDCENVLHYTNTRIQHNDKCKFSFVLYSYVFLSRSILGQYGTVIHFLKKSFEKLSTIITIQQRNSTLVCPKIRFTG